jgi:hypothetical protein
MLGITSNLRYSIFESSVPKAGPITYISEYKFLNCSKNTYFEEKAA